MRILTTMLIIIAASQTLPYSYKHVQRSSAHFMALLSYDKINIHGTPYYRTYTYLFGAKSDERNKLLKTRF